jgi:hypothetical protein
METGTAVFAMVLWVLLTAAALLSATLGIVFAYHWFNYSMNKRISFTAIAVYAMVCFVLLFILLALALST